MGDTLPRPAAGRMFRGLKCSDLAGFPWVLSKMSESTPPPPSTTVQPTVQNSV
uniref:Uncharacterized protein n=1 Tax=Anguilla anguilla TaxID=7936 RepID=A0A0E9SYY9_ANGAN